MHLIKLIVPLTLLCTIFFFITKHLKKPLYHATTHHAQSFQEQAAPRILILSRNSGMCGIDIHAINSYKEHRMHGTYTLFLTPHNPEFASFFHQHNLPFYTYDPFNISWTSKRYSNYGFSYQPCLENAIFEICKKHNISIIHCNNVRELFAARKIAQKLPLKICYTHHNLKPMSLDLLKSIDGFISVNNACAQEFEKIKTTHHFSHQKIACIQPFYDEEKFLSFTPPPLSREEFFQQTFNVTLKKNVPLICMIAYFYSDKRKNHELVLKAAQKLIFEKNKPIQIVFAGNGPSETYYRNLTHELKLNDYVHFLGSTQKTPELLFYSDINLLASKEEAFGIAAVEGALMKKPIIVSNVIGSAGTLILHEQTGLLFENNNVDSLVENIECFLDKPEVAKALGENAYTHVIAHYSNQAKFKKLLSFYHEVIKNS